MPRLSIIILLLCEWCCAQNQSPISVWLTTTLDKAKLLSKQSNLDWVVDQATAQHVIDVDDSVTYQEVDGLGATLSDSSAWLINQQLLTNKNKRQNLLKDLFDKRSGIGLDLVRLSIGPSAFSTNNLTYDETCCNVDDFTIQRDKDALIPTIKAIQLIVRRDRVRGNSKNVLFFSMGWSPPAWMKTSSSLVGGELSKTEISNFATYLWKYIRNYFQEDIPIYAVLPQNEPQYRSCCYPSMWMDAETQSNLISEKLYPIFEKYKSQYNHSTKVVVFSQTQDELKTYAPAVLQNRKTRNYVSGIAFTCYRGQAIDQTAFHRRYPEQDLWMVECTDEKQNNEAGSFQGLFRRTMNREVIAVFRNWARGIMKGNLVLDETFGPTNGGCNNCKGMVTIKPNGDYTLNSAYYAYGHLSKFLRRGAKRILSTSLSSTLETVAFENKNGEKILLVYNNLKEWPVPFKVKWGDISFHHTIPQYSAMTFVWRGSTKKRSAFERIEAESYSESLGISLHPCKDESGCGESVGSTENEDFILFRNIDFGDGANTISLRIASERMGIVALKLDSLSAPEKLIMVTEKTGGYENWITKSSEIPVVKGTHNVYLIFRGQGSYLCNLNWVVFGNQGSIEGSTIPEVVIDDRDYYKIVAKHSNKVFEVDDGDRNTAGLQIRQWEFYYADWQKFNFKPVSNGCYKIFVKHSKLVLDHGDDDIVKQNTDRNDGSQSWRIIRTVDGYVQIQSCSTGKVMQVKDAGKENGAYITVGNNQHEEQQEFSIVMMETVPISDEEKEPWRREKV